MNIESSIHENPYDRINLNDPKLHDIIREAFGTLLQDRATDPERIMEDKELYDFGEKILAGQKIKRRVAALSIFSGACFNSLENLHLNGNNVIYLQRFFFENGK